MTVELFYAMAFAFLIGVAVGAGIVYEIDYDLRVKR